MTGPAATVTVANPGWWRGRAAELVERLRALASESTDQTIVDPGGRPLDPDDALVVTDPSYWVAHPVELDEVVTLATSPGFAAEPAAPDQVPGAAPAVEGRLTMTVEEAAVALGISRALAYEAARRGEIPVVRIGRRMLVPRAALTRLLEQAERGEG